MTLLLRKCIATSLALFLAAAAHAAPLGTVAQLDGILLAKKADGRARVLAQGSAVEQGDTLLAEAETYASVRLAAGGELTLQPDSQLRFDAPRAFTLSKGGLRGSGNFDLDTPGGKVEVRGTAILQLVAGGAPGALLRPILVASLDVVSDAPLILAQLNIPLPAGQPPVASPGSSGSMLPGLYVQVIDGAINLSNRGGAQQFSAGQFGYTASLAQAPVVVPQNPGLKFNPPPAFSTTASASNANTSTKPKTVDCEVR